MTAEGLYRRALSLDDSNLEAKDALRNINDTIQVSGAEHLHTSKYRRILQNKLQY